MINILKKNFHFGYIIFFSIILIFFGINDVEEYQRGTLSTKLHWQSFKSFFNTFFYDSIGPGVKIPIGPGPYNHPLNFFLFNTKIYYFLLAFLHLSIQLVYTCKLFKFYKISFNKHLLTILLIFSLPNISFYLANDWLTSIISYSLLPAVFYYFVKIIDTQKPDFYFKFSIFFCFWILNGTISHISIYIVFLFFYFIFSIENFRCLKKIFNIYFLINILFILLILSEKLFFIIREMSIFEGYRVFHGTHDLIHLLEIFFPYGDYMKNFFKFNKIFPFDRLPGNPILIFFAVFISIISIKNFFLNTFKIDIKKKNYNYFKFFKNKLNKDLNFKFSVLFIIFFIFSLIPFLSVLKSVGGGYLARDIYLYIGLFIFFLNLNKLNKFLKNLLNFFLIFYTFAFLIIHLEQKILLNPNNFVLDKNKNSEIVNKLNELNLDYSDYKRIYLSPNIYSNFSKKFSEDGLFSIIDLTKFDLSPFNGDFKFVSMKWFGDENKLLAGEIKSHLNLMNDQFFLNFFKINYFLIDEDEILHLKKENLEIIFKINTSYKNLFLVERKVKNLSISDENLEILKKNLFNCKVVKFENNIFVNSNSKLECVLKNKSLFHETKFDLIRNFNGNFTINEINTFENILLPFVFNDSWKIENATISLTDDFLFLVKPKSSKNEININYFDEKLFIFKVVSNFSFFMLVVIFLINKNKSYLIFTKQSKKRI